MQITEQGVVFSDYISNKVRYHVCSFTDASGATLHIDTITLMRMYYDVKTDLERKGLWQEIVDEYKMSRP